MFILKSFLFTLFSPAFYKEAVQKGTSQAFSVYFAFTLIVTAITTVYFLVTFGLSLRNIPEQMPSFPDIEISDGVLTTDPAQPFEATEGGQYFGIDSTGTVTEIPEGYNSGILFGHDRVIFRSEDQYGDTEVTYNEILDTFSRDSFSVDKNSIASFIQKMGIVVMVFSPLVIFVSSFVGTLISIFIIAILGLIILSMQGTQNAFNKSFIIAMYAAIPVYYVSIFFTIIGKIANQLDIDFSLSSLCCLIPILFSLIKWGTFWGLGAWGVSRKQ